MPGVICTVVHSHIVALAQVLQQALGKGLAGGLPCEGVVLDKGRHGVVDAAQHLVLVTVAGGPVVVIRGVMVVVAVVAVRVLQTDLIRVDLGALQEHALILSLLGGVCVCM